jgi:hypothetical protein
VTHEQVGAEVREPRIMYEVGVEGDLFNPHPENTECAEAGCVPRPEPVYR